MVQSLVDSAMEIIRKNDQGFYTVPTHGLYPFQWNWDSALTALGMAHYDEGRAWTEIETLFDNQWEDGMVPHIIFHKEITHFTILRQQVFTDNSQALMCRYVVDSGTC